MSDIALMRQIEGNPSLLRQRIYGLWCKGEAFWIENGGDLLTNTEPRILYAYRHNARQVENWAVLEMDADGLPILEEAPSDEERAAFERRGIAHLSERVRTPETLETVSVTNV